jgi:hypothetical protein
MGLKLSSEALSVCFLESRMTGAEAAIQAV